MKIIGKQANIIKVQQDELAEKDAESKMFWNSPIFWFIIGGITMGLGVGLAK